MKSEQEIHLNKDDYPVFLLCWTLNAIRRIQKENQWVGNNDEQYSKTSQKGLS